jgi:hypothetical protein
VMQVPAKSGNKRFSNTTIHSAHEHSSIMIHWSQYRKSWEFD